MKRTRADNDPEALKEMEGLVKRGWIKRYFSKIQAKRSVKGRIIMSDLIVLTKTKLKKEANGKFTKELKRRLLLNLKKSGVTSISVKTERPELPRILDVVFSNLELLRGKRDVDNARLRHLILDFTHAFFNFPNRPDERRYFATRLQQFIYTWMRTVQGSRGAPLICGRALALAMRLAASTTDRAVLNASTYVDDPIISVMGSSSEQDVAIGQFVGSLLAMGFDLAFAKAQDSAFEDVVVWTSGKLQILHDEQAIAVEIKDEILAELQENITHMIKSNIVSIDSLRELAGRANCVSSLLHTWRPFVAMLWAPIYNTRSRTPFDPGKVWFTAVKIPLYWLQAFLVGTAGTLRRVYALSSYLGEGDQVQIVRDASPVGLGAYLRINNEIAEYTFGEITSSDQDVLQVASGGSEGQQVWESLIILAALQLNFVGLVTVISLSGMRDGGGR